MEVGAGGQSTCPPKAFMSTLGDEFQEQQQAHGSLRLLARSPRTSLRLLKVSHELSISLEAASGF